MKNFRLNVMREDMTKQWPSLDTALDALSPETYQQKWDYSALVECLRSLAGRLVRATAEQRRELIAKFHDCAGKLPYPDDSDIGSLFLESAAERAPDAAHRKWLYEEAFYRAKWCAESGTSGGETLARSRRLERLSDRLKNA